MDGSSSGQYVLAGCAALRPGLDPVFDHDAVYPFSELFGSGCLCHCYVAGYLYIELRKGVGDPAASCIWIRGSSGPVQNTKNCIRVSG